MGPAALRALACIVVWAGFAGAGLTVVNTLRPVQRLIFQTLMPDFDVKTYALERRAGQWKLRAQSVNRRYLFVSGHAVEPGVGFDVETPARTGLFHAVLILSGLIVLAPRRRPRGWMPIAVAVALAGLMAVGEAPLVLAGQQWGLAVAPWQDISLPALLVGASDALLHGAGLALAVLIVTGGALVTRPSRDAVETSRRAAQ